MKKKISLLLTVLIVISTCLIPEKQSRASGYPVVAPKEYFMTANVGDVVEIVYDYFPEFKNEKIEVNVYNENGKKVASSTHDFYHTSNKMIEYTVTWDTSKYEPGEYTISAKLYFYSLFKWNEGPREYTSYLTLNKATYNSDSDPSYDTRENNTDNNQDVDTNNDYQNNSQIQIGKFASYQGFDFYGDTEGNIKCYDSEGNIVTDDFKCDGTYTYFFQADGTAMKSRLTYHPDGEHVIYFDSAGHEVFSDFANVKKSISGDPVDDYCFFDVFGYMYVNVLTYDKSGSNLYYANPYGVMEMGEWFQFSDTVKWADGTSAVGVAGGYGYANADGTLLTNTYTTDWLGRNCYLQGNGVAVY